MSYCVKHSPATIYFPDGTSCPLCAALQDCDYWRKAASATRKDMNELSTANRIIHSDYYHTKKALTEAEKTIADLRTSLDLNNTFRAALDEARKEIADLRGEVAGCRDHLGIAKQVLHKWGDAPNTEADLLQRVLNVGKDDRR